MTKKRRKYELWRCVEGQLGENEWMVYSYYFASPSWFTTEAEARKWIAAQEVMS